MNWMFIGDDGDWWCQHCVTHALMFESVSHFPDCPVVLNRSLTTPMDETTEETSHLEYVDDMDYPF